MKKIWILILFVSLGLNLGLGLRLLQNREPTSGYHETGGWGKVSAQGGAASDSDTTHGRKMGHRRLDRLAKHLDLTPEQKKTFAKTGTEIGKRMVVRRSEMQAARAELMELVTNESTPPEILRSSLRNLAARQAEIDSVITEVLLLELEVLDPDQRRQYLDMLPMNHRGPSGMRGRGRGHRGPG